jgi:hypothetical protein
MYYEKLHRVASSRMTKYLFVGGLFCFVSVAFGYGEEANSPPEKAVRSAWDNKK